MTTALNFAALPPEINSARMYTGPGAGSMLAAASAWHGLAAELRATALSYESVLSGLTGEEWFGPASASMAAAAAPYVVWLSATAAQAEQTAAQAEAAAGAYETAFAATVAPPLVAANRARLMTLIATNFLGQNTPAIAATEAEYLEMWAQDAAAMFGYAASSAAATALTPFVEPQQTTSLDGPAAQAANPLKLAEQAAGTAAASQQTTLTQLVSAVPAALHGLAGANTPAGLSDIANLLLTGTGPAGLENIWAQWGPNANFWNTVTSTGLLVPGSTFGSFLGLMGNGPAAADAAGGALQAAGTAVSGPLASAGGLGGVTSAGMGNSGIVGKLSVPPAWTAAPPPMTPLGPALGGTPMIAPPPAGTPGMPGVPLVNPASQSFGRAVPQYGFRPTVVARTPAAG